MKKTLFLLVVVGLISSCSTTKTLSNTSDVHNSAAVETDSDRDGSSFEEAIVIKEKTEGAGVDAEYEWLAKNYPGYKTKMQSLNSQNKKHYDIITISTSQGVEKKIYFDITNFYGKF